MRWIAHIPLSFAFIAAGVGFSGAEPTPEAFAELMKRQFQIYTQCLTLQSDKLDDGISDAQTIATVIVRLCKKERHEFFLKSDFKSTLILKFWSDPPSPDDLATGTDVVLHERAKRRPK